MTYFTYENGDPKKYTTRTKGTPMGMAARLKRYEAANRDWLYKAALYAALTTAMIAMYIAFRAQGWV